MTDAQILEAAARILFGPNAIREIRQQLDTPLAVALCSPYPPAYMTITFCLPADTVRPVKAANAISRWAEQMKALGVRDMCIGIQKNKSAYTYECLLGEMQGKAEPLFGVKVYEAPDGTCTAQARELPSPPLGSGCAQSG